MKQKCSCIEDGFTELLMIAPIPFSPPMNKQNFPRHISAQMVVVVDNGC